MIQKLIFIFLEQILSTMVAAQFKSQPRLQSYQITNAFPHDPEAFTQGLEYDEICDESSENCTDVLWESTGKFLFHSSLHPSVFDRYTVSTL